MPSNVTDLSNKSRVPQTPAQKMAAVKAAADRAKAEQLKNVGLPFDATSLAKEISDRANKVNNDPTSLTNAGASDLANGVLPNLTLSLIHI